MKVIRAAVRDEGGHASMNRKAMRGEKNGKGGVNPSSSGIGTSANQVTQ